MTGRSVPSGVVGRGFTLIELLLAVSIMAMISVFTFVAFSAVTTAWRQGQRLTESLHHADYAIEQLVMALRSAYYPAVGVHSDYGFQLRDDGDGPGSWDEMSWVKVGNALVGREERLAGTPHRVELSHERAGRGEDGDVLVVRGWRLLDEVENFKADSIESVELSRQLLGLNVRCQDPEEEDPATMTWTDEWKFTNRIPRAVELTLYMDAGDKRKPVTVQRIVELPLAPLAWGGSLGGPPSPVVPGGLPGRARPGGDR